VGERLIPALSVNTSMGMGVLGMTMMKRTESRKLRSRSTRVLMISVISAFLAIAVGSALPSLAQPPAPDAEGVAALVQSFYDGTTTVQARFHQTYFNKLYNRTDRSPGTVVFKRPGKMRWDYRNGKIMASNGQNLLVYEPPGEGETEGQGIEHEMNDHQLPDAFAFLTGTARLETLFTFRLLDNQRVGGFEGGYVLELRARNASPHYEKLLFFVTGGAAPGVVRRVLIIDAAGNRNRFDFQEMQFNRNVPDSRFSFRFPANTRRITP
jgi:outer membrane lipoprotein carrier protein